MKLKFEYDAGFIKHYLLIEKTCGVYAIRNFFHPEEVGLISYFTSHVQITGTFKRFQPNILIYFRSIVKYGTMHVEIFITYC